MWYLNEYIVKDKLKFKIVKYFNCYENWELVDTYILHNGKFYSKDTYLKTIATTNSKKTTFKKLLAFFNKL